MDVKSFNIGSISLTGVGQFNDKILWMKIEDEKEIKGYRKGLFEAMKCLKVCTILEQDRAFNPHGTLFNLFWSKDKELKLDLKLLEKYKNYSFGTFKFDSIELNRMGSKGDYYESEVAYKINN
jgi:2'-5' RNA ligase